MQHKNIHSKKKKKKETGIIVILYIQYGAFKVVMEIGCGLMREKEEHGRMGGWTSGCTDENGAVHFLCGQRKMRISDGSSLFTHQGRLPRQSLPHKLYCSPGAVIYF